MQYCHRRVVILHLNSSNAVLFATFSEHNHLALAQIKTFATSLEYLKIVHMQQIIQILLQSH